MYIDKLHYLNVGPIERVDIDFLDVSSEAPCPTIFVGKNGSGKSTLLSNIVDALYEIAAQGFTNAVYRSDSFNYSYYKVIAPQQVTLGHNDMVAYLKIKDRDRTYEYIDKYTDLSKQECSDKYQIDLGEAGLWSDEIAYKSVSVSKDDALRVFENEVICYFGPTRFAKPSWLGNNYFPFAVREGQSNSPQGSINGILSNQIEPDNSLDALKQWICDVVTDARPEVQKGQNGYEMRYPSNSQLDSSISTKQNIETILSQIMGEAVTLRLLNRLHGETRLSLVRPESGTVVTPSLDALSSGQHALLHIFGNILRYADNLGNNKTYRLDKIKGIVVIDEIELHLHSQLQREVLPQLIKLFPQIQFIITSHSPLFLLGMQNTFSNDKFTIYEMPMALEVSAEQFSEFDSAYQCFTHTIRFQEDLRAEIDKQVDTALVITEGASDWRHLQAALNSLKTNPDLAWLSQQKFGLLKYDPDNSSYDDSEFIKLQMSSSELVTLCKALSKLPHSRKIIAIADRDVDKDIRQLMDTNQSDFKYWGNNVYSLCLPVPDSRLNTPKICIEHYYDDETIKRVAKCQDGVCRRLFLGNEFDECGRGYDNGKFCKNMNACGKGKINIIDGGSCKVLPREAGDEQPNYALTKMDFANMILNKEHPFESVDFDNFIPLFHIIQKILES